MMLFYASPAFVASSVACASWGVYECLCPCQNEESHRRAHGVRLSLQHLLDGVDTVNIAIAFAGTLADQNLLTVILSWLVKVVWEIIALPLTLPLVRFVKKISAKMPDIKADFNLFYLTAGETCCGQRCKIAGTEHDHQRNRRLVAEHNMTQDEYLVGILWGANRPARAGVAAAMW